MIYLGIVSLLWAFSFGLIGSSLTSADSFLVATIRLACATLLFLPWLRIKIIGKFDCLRLISYGAIQFGLMYVCYMKAFQYIPSHLVALFSILTPLYVVLINDARQKQFSGRYLLAALLSVLGAASIKAKSMPSGDFWTGFGLMQIAGISFAYGQVAYRDWKCQHVKISDRTGFSLLCLGGMICAGIFSYFWTDWNTINITLFQWKSILYLGFIASGLGFFLWNKGAALSTPGTLAAFNNAVVPLAVLCSLFIFDEIKSSDNETISRLAMGSILIIGAVFIAQKKGIQ